MKLIQLIETMMKIRAFEDVAENAALNGDILGPLHLSTGQEAVPTGVCAAMRPEDWMSSNHRGHGHTIARGAELSPMLAELYGKATGINGGKGGSMHVGDFSKGMLGANGIVAAGIPIAVGAAHGLKLQKKDGIVVCFFGDGSINRGPFSESLNWAKVFELPILFVCEDNKWSATVKGADSTAGQGAHARALSMDIPYVTVDGNDVVEVYENASQLMDMIRNGAGPMMLHCSTYRFKGHIASDKAHYRSKFELEEALKNDPIPKAILKWESQHQQKFPTAIMDKIKDDLLYAEAMSKVAPSPESKDAFSDISDIGEGQWY